MICFWVDADGRSTIQDYLVQDGRRLASRFEVRSYEELTAECEIVVGTHVFSAMDQLSPAGLSLAAALHDSIATTIPDALRLNDPRIVLHRYDLLKRMFETGINAFQVWHAHEPAGAIRFPVFVREAAGHSGSLTRLLPDARALSRALRSLRVRGLRLEDLLVVEFCDLAWEDGMYRKASAYKIGNAIVPAQLVRGQAWSLKWHEGEWNQPALRDLVDYVTDNPHQEWLRRVFELAGVDYGRCDYGIRGDTLQVWEINFNPTVGYRTWPPEPLPPLLNPLMENFRSVHYSALENAFHAVDGSGPRERVKIRLDPDLISRVTRVSTGMRRRGKVLQFLHAVYERPRIGRPLRFLLRRLFPPG